MGDETKPDDATRPSVFTPSDDLQQSWASLHLPSHRSAFEQPAQWPEHGQRPDVHPLRVPRATVRDRLDEHLKIGLKLTIELSIRGPQKFDVERLTEQPLVLARLDHGNQA